MKPNRHGLPAERNRHRVTRRARLDVKSNTRTRTVGIGGCFRGPSLPTSGPLIQLFVSAVGLSKAMPGVSDAAEGSARCHSFARDPSVVRMSRGGASRVCTSAASATSPGGCNGMRTGWSAMVKHHDHAGMGGSPQKAKELDMNRNDTRPLLEPRRPVGSSAS